MAGTVIMIAILVIAPIFISLGGAAAAALLGQLLNKRD